MNCFGRFGLAVGYCSTGRTIKEAMTSLGVNPCEECYTKMECMARLKTDKNTDRIMPFVQENIRTGFALRQRDDIRKEGVFSV